MYKERTEYERKMIKDLQQRGKLDPEVALLLESLCSLIDNTEIESSVE